MQAGTERTSSPISRYGLNAEHFHLDLSSMALLRLSCHSHCDDLVRCLVVLVVVVAWNVWLVLANVNGCESIGRKIGLPSVLQSYVRRRNVTT